MMTMHDIEQILEKHPKLHHNGVALYGANKMTPGEREQLLAHERQKFLHSRGLLESCNKVCEWLDGVEIKKTFSDSSYGLKHDMEEQTKKYVTNGEFIIAAIYCGVPHKYRESGPNVDFGITARWLKSKRKAKG